MKSVIVCCIVICCGILNLQVYAQDQEELPTFNLMDPTPPFKVFEWLKGEPVTNFKKDHLYIIEFTGIGCKACRTSIPHLSKLADENAKDVTIISVFVTENDGEDSVSTLYVDHVRKFVTAMGNKMRYRIAVDDPRQTLVRTWMTPSGTLGIPYVFVIKNGVLIWIDQPLLITNSILQSMRENKFDGKREQIRRENNKAGLRIYYAKKEGNFLLAIHLLDSLIQAQPQNILCCTQKFETLLEFDEAKAYAYGYSVLRNECKNDESMLTLMAREVAYKSDAGKLRHPDWDLALTMIQRALELNKAERIAAIIYDVQGLIYEQMKDYKRAITSMENAISALQVFDKKDHDASSAILFDQDCIKRYKSKL